MTLSDMPANHLRGGYGGGCRCTVCTTKKRDQQAAWRARAAAEPPPPSGDPRHGTTSTYIHRRCRCEPCREAMRASNLRQRMNAKTKARLDVLRAEMALEPSLETQFGDLVEG